MSESLNELFQTAAKYFFHKYKTNGGTLGKLSHKIGTSHTYISAVINGSRTASLELQDQIAHALYGPYDKFIAAGRQIRQGLQPETINYKDPDSDIETLIARLTHYVMRQRETERQLQISKQKYRDISLTTGDLIFELNEKLAFTYLAGRIYESSGRTREELLHKTPFDFLDPQETIKLQALLDEAIKSSRIVNCDITVHQNGALQYLNIIAKPFFNQNGEFQGFRGTYRDITREKNLQHMLEERNWLFESAINSIEHVALIITDKNGTVLQWNRSYQQLMAYPDEVLATRNLTKYYEYLEDKLTDPELFHKSIEDLRNSCDKTVCLFQLKDGRTIKKKVCPLHKEGILSGRIAHLMDVSHDM